MDIEQEKLCRADFEAQFDFMYAEEFYPDDSYFEVHPDEGFYLNEKVLNEFGFFRAAWLKTNVESESKSEVDLDQERADKINSLAEKILIAGIKSGGDSCDLVKLSFESARRFYKEADNTIINIQLAKPYKGR